MDKYAPQPSPRAREATLLVRTHSAGPHLQRLIGSPKDSPLTRHEAAAEVAEEGEEDEEKHEEEEEEEREERGEEEDEDEDVFMADEEKVHWPIKERARSIRGGMSAEEERASSRPQPRSYSDGGLYLRYRDQGLAPISEANSYKDPLVYSTATQEAPAAPEPIQETRFMDFAALLTAGRQAPSPVPLPPPHPPPAAALPPVIGSPPVRSAAVPRAARRSQSLDGGPLLKQSLLRSITPPGAGPLGQNPDHTSAPAAGSAASPAPTPASADSGPHPEAPGSTHGADVAAAAPQKTRLMLHVDINKTILIRDQVQDAGSDSMVNVLLSECAWGRLMPGNEWVAVGRLATDRPASDPELMTYRSFLDTFKLPFKRGYGKEVDKENEGIKSQRQALKRTFTSPGQPGEMFLGVHQKLLASLAVPEEKQAAMRELGIGDGTEYMLLPSFFELLKHLAAQGREFVVIFRTFGTDLLEIAHELNLFCEGRHPFHPGVRLDGTSGNIDMRLRFPERLGCFLRHGLAPDGTILALHPPVEAVSSRSIRPEVLEQCAEGDLHRSFHEIYDAISRDYCAREKGCASLALRDYYPWWKAHQERAKSGKLLLIDPEDPSTHQIFFDDNIGAGSAHIVDARDVNTGKPIPFNETNNRYLVKVEPLHAILDHQYFIRAVRRCEEAQTTRCMMEMPGLYPDPGLSVGRAKWRIVKSRIMNILRLASE